MSGTPTGALIECYRGPQFELATLAAFAGVGLALALIGIFSVMAYSVSLQVHEIGIRMALGAQRASVLRGVLARGLRLILAGMLLGVLLSYVTGQLLASQISGVSVRDPQTLALVAATMAITGLGACYFPARRATHVDPLVALRCE